MGRYLRAMDSKVEADVIICSRAITSGKKRNNVGDLIQGTLKKLSVGIKEMRLIDDLPELILDQVKRSSGDIILFSGGTSRKSKFVVVETLAPLVNERFREMEDEIKSHGLHKTPLAERSSPLVGKIGEKVVLAIPGSTNGAKDALEVIFPRIFALMNLG